MQLGEVARVPALESRLAGGEGVLEGTLEHLPRAGTKHWGYSRGQDRRCPFLLELTSLGTSLGQLFKVRGE